MVRFSSSYLFCVLLIGAMPVCAEEINNPPASAFHVLGMFDEQRSPTNFFGGEVVSLDEDEAAKAAAEKAEKELAEQKAAEAKQAEEKAKADEEKKNRDLIFVGDDPTKHILPPDEEPQMRIEKNAPPSLVGMVKARIDGDHQMARAYARQFVRYQKKMLFEIRQMTKLIGEALVDENVIDDEDWDGVEQLLNYELANARGETGSVLKATHEDAMKRVKADANNKAEIYYFFTLSSSFSRKMAPDIERLWQVAKRDPNLKMVALTMGPQPKLWIDSYREYTGLTVPIYEGEAVAKSFNVRFVPALVVVSPTSDTAYLKTGQQSFSRMYEFVRKVQGLPATLSPGMLRLVSKPIGDVEKQAQKDGLFKVPTIAVAKSAKSKTKVKRVTYKRPQKKQELSRF